MATVTRGTLSSLLAPGLRKVIFDRYNQYPEQYSTIFRIGSSTRKDETDQTIGGLEAAGSKTEGASISYTSPIEGYEKTYTHATYGMGVRVTEEMYEDEQYGVMKKMAAALGRSARYTVETTAASVFNGGFTNTGPDGYSFFYASHPLLGGSTFANRPSTEVDLSVAALKAGLTQLRKQVDDRNMLIAIKAQMLVVHPNDEWVAKEILNSAQAPYTADNEVNVLRGALKLVVWDYLTDTDAWFIGCGKVDHEVNFFWRRKIASQASDDFDTGDAKFKVTGRWSSGYTDWRGWYGSTGI